MCGIAGWIDPSAGAALRREAVGRMCAAMEHRGPDDLGIEEQGEATLGMRRLAIFDPANGHQPMRTPDGRITLVFNGAIYNFRALRAELESGGWAFRTQCDTEVLLAAYARWGEACLPRLRGMFAFAAWNAETATLFFARDPFGIKPLYYRHDGQRLLFGSEVGALLAAGAFSAEIDPAAVADYLSWFAVPAPRTIYRGVFSLRPGESARFRQGRLELQSSWSFRDIPRDIRPCASRQAFVGELRERLDDSIRAHLLADVPVGAFLSGGLDSAVVVGLMTRAAGARLRTFSIGFEEAGYSEAAEAEASARHFGAEHRSRILTGREVAADLERIFAAYDQPTGDGINTYYASQAAHAGGVKVALSGLGGDELFGGYPSFRNLPRLSAWLPRWRRLPRSFRSLVVARLRRGDTRWQKLADMLQHAHDVHELGSLQRRVFSEPGRRALLTREAHHALERSSPFHPELSRLSSQLTECDSFSIASAWELRTYMADVLLRDSDVMSMRHALELRVPFVDRPLLDWLWRQPSAFKDTPGQPKSVLAAAAADILPPNLGLRRKKGFTLPFAIWMRRELRPFMEDVFSAGSIQRSGLFDGEAVQSLWHGFLENDDAREWSRLWSLAVLIAFVNRRAPPPPPPPAAVAVSPIRPLAVRRRRPATLLLAPEIFSSPGGIPRILQTYLKALSDLGAPANDPLRLIALNDPSIDSGDIRRYAGRELDDWLVCGRDKRRFVRGALKMSRGCRRILCGHVNQLPVAWLMRRLHPRLRYYLIAHGIEVWRPFRRHERIALRGAERIFCVSDYTRRELLRHCPLPEERAVVLPNALDPYFTIENGAPLGRCPPVILVVTRLNYADQYKGVEHLIAALPLIRAAEPEARLRIIGQGDDLPRLQDIARRHGVLNHGVEFLGFVPDRYLAEEMGACRLFALPSKKEGFGLVFLEAMARGRPCLGARAGGIPEVITEETGVLVEFGDVPALAQAAVAALRRPWDSQAMLDRARYFSYESFRQRLAALLPP